VKELPTVAQGATAADVRLVNCIVGGTGVALGLQEADLGKAISIVIGILAGLVLFIAFAWYQLRQFRRVSAAVASGS